MSKFREKIQRFMAGRNGNDGLNILIMIVYLVLFVVNTLLSNFTLSIIELVLVIYWFFRFYSRNLAKRQMENQWFLGIYSHVKRFFNRLFHRSNQTKTTRPKKSKR